MRAPHRQGLLARHRLPGKMAQGELHRFGLRPQAVALHDRPEIDVFDLDVRAHPAHTPIVHLTCKLRVPDCEQPLTLKVRSLRSRPSTPSCRASGTAATMIAGMRIALGRSRAGLVATRQAAGATGTTGPQGDDIRTVRRATVRPARKPGQAVCISQQHGEDLADGGLPAGRLGQWQVGLDPVAVAAAVSLLHHVAGLGEVGDDAMSGALGDAQAGGDVAQPDPWVVGDAQQHPGVVGQETPFRHARKLAQLISGNALPAFGSGPVIQRRGDARQARSRAAGGADAGQMRARAR